MMTFEQQRDITDERLHSAGFHTARYSDLGIPDLQSVSVGGNLDVPYVVMGDPSAYNLVFAHTPYSTSVTDTSILVRLAAQQTALGEDYCVVGATTYHPEQLRLDNASERKAIKDGDFSPFSKRMMRVIDKVQTSDDHAVSLYGFSMGADVATDITYQMMTNANFGEFPIVNLGILEPARVVKRGRLAMISAFAGSGNDLFENVIASASPALLEARGIDLGDNADDYTKAKKLHDKEVTMGVMKYSMADLKGVLSVIKGFGHDTTVDQLRSIERVSGRPQTFLARASESGVFPEQAFNAIDESVSLAKYTIEGDHSVADDVWTGGVLIRLAMNA